MNSLLRLADKDSRKWIHRKWRRSASTPHDDSSSSLRELLLQHLKENKNYEGGSFLCMATVKELLTRERISSWINSHPLHRHSDTDTRDQDLIDCIVNNSSLLFAMLVVAELEHLTSALLLNDRTDHSLPEIDCNFLHLTLDEQDRLDNCRYIAGPVLGKRHLYLSLKTVLPFVERISTNKSGAYGQIYSVKVADGHLEGYDKSEVAEKQIRLHDPGDERFALNEIETLRERKHPNIVPLLASYTLTTMESEFPVTTMHLIFPFADKDLKEWMTNPQPPDCLQGLPRSERRAYLYRCIYALVSSLSFLHREQGGIVTAHHDLNPRNILVFGPELKLADFGRSHLRPLAEGSETAAELGTYEYQPPEYWNDDGSQAVVKHGRVFDVWSMGCIIIELATLIVYDWEGKKVTFFREKRQKNPSKTRPMDVRRHREDKSFHNNWAVVKDWIHQLQVEDASPKLKSTLRVALQMIDRTPSNRIYNWEAELDLYNIQHPDDDQVMQLERGALCVQPPPPQKKNLNGAQTPLHRAAQAGNLARLLQLLEFGWSPSVQDHSGQTAIDLFNQSQEPYPCKILRERLAPKLPAKPTDEPQRQKLFQASTEGQVHVVQELLGQGVDPMSVDERGCSALYKAVVHNQSDVVKCLLQAKGKDLLRHKESLRHDTPLHKAAVLGHVDIMEQLLAYSPDIEDQQKENKTALFLAAESGHDEAIQVLLAHEAQAFTQSNVKETPLHGAVKWNRVKALKRLLGANDAGKCLEHKNQTGDTPLWLAVFRNHPECAQVLVDKKASVHVANKDDMSVLHFVVEGGLQDFLEKNLHLFNRQDIDARNVWDHTPLMLADMRRKHNIYEILKDLRDQG